MVKVTFENSFGLCLIGRLNVVFAIKKKIPLFRYDPK
jgi:hypothetical protein